MATLCAVTMKTPFAILKPAGGVLREARVEDTVNVAPGVGRTGGTGVLFVERSVGVGVVVSARGVDVAPGVEGKPVAMQAKSKQSVNTKTVDRTGALSGIIASLQLMCCDSERP